MSDLSIISGQILDKISDIVSAPVQGQVNVTATSSSTTVIVPQGQLGRLADNRIVRVVKGTSITGTTPAPVPVRLLYLTPAYPAKNNFAPVNASTTVTWISPPAGLTATGSVAALFAKNATIMASGVPQAIIAACGEFAELSEETQMFATGADGAPAAILLEPDVRFIEKRMARGRLAVVRSLWRLRVNYRWLGTQKDARIKARDIFDALAVTVIGATAGSWEIWGDGWKRVPSRGEGVFSNEFTFLTHHVSEGRPMQPQTDQSFSTFGQDMVVNDNPTTPAQPSPFHVKDDVPIT